MRSYLGIDVPDDAHGVLQDVHWAGGDFGYFPTYSLGNVIAAQLWEAVRRASRPRRARSSGASSGRCASGCASTSTATGASTPPTRWSSGRRAGRSRSAPYVSYLTEKFRALYG